MATHQEIVLIVGCRRYRHTVRMFDKKAEADAEILADEGPSGSEDADIHGVHWDHHKFILEVRPAGEAPFRVETKAKVPIRSSPRTGDVVRVSYDPKNHKTEILIAGDPRYDPKIIRETTKEQRAAMVSALLAGGPSPAAQGPFLNVDDREDY